MWLDISTSLFCGSVARVVGLKISMFLTNQTEGKDGGLLVVADVVVVCLLMSCCGCSHFVH